MSRLPEWIRTGLDTSRDFKKVSGLVSELGLHTVCQSARCPNRAECWNRGTATMMILGDSCTRACRFCAVGTGQPLPPDPSEPERVAEAARAMGLRHVVLTSVTRDDLPDGGAAHFGAVIRAVRGALPHSSIEVLTPDFKGSEASVSTVLAERPDVFGHNLETVRRLQPAIRPQASYEGSLHVLRLAARHRPPVAVKSGIMVGLGETDEELFAAMRDLREAGCSLLSIGQYLAPTRKHTPVSRYVEPGAFRMYAEKALALGFANVAAGPLVRSSYRADELLEAARGK